MRKNGYRKNMYTATPFIENPPPIFRRKKERDRVWVEREEREESVSRNVAPAFHPPTLPSLAKTLAALLRQPR